MTRSRVSLAISLLLALLFLSGCGSGADRAQRMTLAALAIPAPTPPSPLPAPSVRCTNLTASLRPPATLPAPGRMPAGSWMERIRKRGYLTAGVDQNTLLFAYFNPLDGQIEGFEIDLLHQLAAAIFGNPNAVRLQAITTAERISAVQNGTVDVVADAMTITCARKQQVDFSTVYYNAGQRLLVPTDSPIHGPRDLAGKRVCATKGSTSLQVLEQLHAHPIPFKVTQRTDCLVALQQGLVDAVTSDDSILLGFKAQDPRTKLVGPAFAPDPYGMAISRAHPEFVRFVNGVLAKLRANGTWQAVYRRWLGKFSTSIPAPPKAAYNG